LFEFRHAHLPKNYMHIPKEKDDRTIGLYLFIHDFFYFLVSVIYIYIERERERERETAFRLVSTMCFCGRFLQLYNNNTLVRTLVLIQNLHNPRLLAVFWQQKGKKYEAWFYVREGEVLYFEERARLYPDSCKFIRTSRILPTVRTRMKFQESGCNLPRQVYIHHTRLRCQHEDNWKYWRNTSTIVCGTRHWMPTSLCIFQCPTWCLLL